MSTAWRLKSLHMINFMGRSSDTSFFWKHRCLKNQDKFVYFLSELNFIWKNCSFSPVFLLYKYYIIFSNIVCILRGYYCTFHGMIIIQQIVGHIKKYWSMIWSWNILSLHTLSWSFTMSCAIKSRLNYQQQKFTPKKLNSSV